MVDVTPDGLSWVRLLLAFVTLIGLLALFGWVMKFLSEKGWLIAGKCSGGKKRLKLIDYLSLDSQNRLVIVQVDEEEHLILLGPQNPLLISRKTAPPLS